MKNSAKYFSSYAESECFTALNLISKSKETLAYQHVICIPVFDENFSSIQKLLGSIKNQSALFILVVNAPLFEFPKDDNSHLDYQRSLADQQIRDLPESIQRTELLAKKINEHYLIINTLDNISLYSLNLNLSNHQIAKGFCADLNDKNISESSKQVTSTNKSNELLVINKLTTQAIPYKEGVGLARKIANDCAALLICEKFITNSIIYNTDADVTLPKDYLLRIIQEKENSSKSNNSFEASAWTFPFEHIHTDNKFQNSASQIYEESLIHYVNGLRHAQSDYAFQTIGSTIAVNAKHYIQARGFPKKNAGEDFYLLNKLRKLGPIHTLSGAPIQLSSRVSHRVPFGTGPALKNLINSGAIQDQPLFYQQECFEILKQFLKFWREAYQLPDCIKENHDIPEAIRYLQISIKPLLTKQGFEELLQGENTSLKLFEKMNRSNNQQHWLNTWQQSFDAFRTLKLLHKLRDLYYPLESFLEKQSKENTEKHKKL